MLKRLVAVLSTVLLAVGLTVGVALPASAHDANYAANCGSLDLNLVYYGAGKSNYVTVTIDGTKVENNTKFGDSFTKSYSWTPNVAHTYKIEIKAQDNGYDKTITGTSSPCTSVNECVNPFSSQSKNFTILTEGNFTSQMSGAHVEGTVAAGGDLNITTRYTTQGNHDGSALPVVDGQSTGLLVGGKANLTASGQAFLVMQGVFRIGDVAGNAAVTDGKRFRPNGTVENYIEGTNTTTVDAVKAPGLFGTTFSGAFTAFKAAADKLAGYSSADAHFVTATNSGNGGKQVTLNAGVTNVLRVSASTLSSMGQIWFEGGVVPSATTPFVIDVTDTGSFNVTAPTLRNIDAKYVLWNFAKATSIGLKTSEFVKGSILAPRAALTLNEGGIEGQIAAASMTVKSVGEIHHIAYSPCAPTTTPVSVTTAPSATQPTCTADGTLVVPAKTGIVWSGGANGAGPGTYTLVATAAPGYTLSGQSTWTITVLPKSDVKCVESVQPTLTVATCDATTGNVKSAFITIPTTANLVYSIGATTYTAGQKVELAQGTYTVNVAATNGYTLTGASSFTINVAAFDCNKAVQPQLTQAECVANSTTVTSAFITIPTTTPGLNYSSPSINGGAVLTPGQSYNVAAGSVVVNVTAKPGVTNTGPSQFTLTVAALDCQKAVQPTVTQAVCTVPAGSFLAGSITIPSTTPGLVYSSPSLLGGAALTAGQKYNLPAGTHTVNVTANAGVRNTGPSQFTIVIAALDCEKAVQPTLAQAQCDATTGNFVSGSITITTTTPGLVYSIGATSYAAGQKVDLAAGTYTVTVTETGTTKNTGPSSFTVTIDALSCEKAVEPTIVVAQCDATTGAVKSATLTAATTTPGLTYTIRGGAVLTPGVATTVANGTVIVDVTAAAGVKNTGPSSFTFNVAKLDCNESVEPTITAGVCNALTGPSDPYLTIPTTTPGLVYSIGGIDYAAGDTVPVKAGQAYTVDVRALPGFENTGAKSFSGTAPTLDCDEVTPVAPKVTDQSCNYVVGGKDTGFLTFTLSGDLTYTVNGATVTTAKVELAPGTYTVKVTPAAGHYLKDGVDEFTVTIAAATGCDNVYTTPLDPFADPEICDPQSTNSLDGSITVVHVAGIQWYIGKKQDGSDKVAVGDDTTVGSVKYAYPAGTYYVFAEAVDPTISIKPGHDEWKLTVDFPSDLCTLGYFDTSASATSAVCNATGDDRGTITVDLMPGVTYSFLGGPVITTATTKVAPGTYTVKAAADDPRSVVSQDTFVLNVAAPSVLCDLETLALTGQNVAGPLAIGFLLLQVGLALIAARFIRMRRARHLAA